MTSPSPIIYQNVEGDITLIDIPTSIAAAQGDRSGVLLSTPPLDTPIEPKEDYRPRTQKSRTNKTQAQDGSRPPRPRKNPLPNPQPPVREIRRLLEWFPYGNPRHLRQHRSTWSLQGSLGNTPPHFPLCRHQISRLRANTRSHNKKQSARNAGPTVHLGQFSRHDERLPDIPPRGNPRAPRL